MVLFVVKKPLGYVGGNVMIKIRLPGVKKPFLIEAPVNFTSEGVARKLEQMIEDKKNAAS